MLQSLYIRIYFNYKVKLHAFIFLAQHSYLVDYHNMTHISRQRKRCVIQVNHFIF